MAKEMAKMNLAAGLQDKEDEGQGQGLLFVLWSLHVGMQGQPARLLG